MSKRAVLILMIFLPLYLTAKSTLEETFKKIIPAAQKTGIEIRNINGYVEVSAWDRDEVEIIAYKKVKADDEEDAAKYLSEVEIEIDDDEDVIAVDVDFPDKSGKNDGFFSWIFSSGGTNSSVAFKIKVPRKFNVDVHSTNGSVSVTECNGRIQLKTINGKITADNVSGSVSAKSTNGKIKVNLRAIDSEEEMSLQTTNGSITLYMPADVKADLEARTTNGRIDCEFDLNEQISGSKRRLEGVINSGGPLIYLKALNGSIHIRKSESD